MKYVCSVCGFEYDEEKGYPEGGIVPGTTWDELPEDFECRSTPRPKVYRHAAALLRFSTDGCARKHIIFVGSVFTIRYRFAACESMVYARFSLQAKIIFQRT